jgi:hypothetical protein
VKKSVKDGQKKGTEWSKYLNGAKTDMAALNIWSDGVVTVYIGRNDF